MSHATAELIADSCPDGVTVHDVGRFALAGMAREEQVSELRITDFEQPASSTRGPRTRSSTTARRRPRAVAGRVSVDARDRRARSSVAKPSCRPCARGGRSRTRATAGMCVLLGGDAGIGKTRLAIEVARACTNRARPCCRAAATRRTSSPTSPSSKRSAGTSAPRPRPRCGPISCAAVRSHPARTRRGGRLPRPSRAGAGRARHAALPHVRGGRTTCSARCVPRRRC